LNARTQTSATLVPISCILLALFLLAALSYWAPWVDHDTAALRLSGQDLGEFVKFLPGFGSARGPFPRQLFYLPPFVCSLGLVLLSSSPTLVYPRWLRVGMLGVALALLPGLLPPVWGRPGELFTSEFRLQGIALGVGLAAVLAHAVFRQVPPVLLGAALVGLALVALIPAQCAFWVIRPRIWAAYNTPTIRLGWGLWLHITSWAGIPITSAVLLRKAIRRHAAP
jgi:hypothetical protein